MDVVSSNSWLNPALAAMEMSQMVVQGMWDRDSQLLQLPHFTQDLAAECRQAGVDSILDLLGMEVTFPNQNIVLVMHLAFSCLTIATLLGES